MGCKTCEHVACPQRAFPPVGRPIDVDEHRTTFAPYPVRGDGDAGRSAR
jgi:predicted transcriptional regulator